MRTKKFALKLLLPFLLSTLTLVSAFALVPMTNAQSLKTFGGGTPKYVTLKHGAPTMATRTALASTQAASSNAVDTIPYWSDLFVAQSSPWPYQMVGTSPKAGSKTTTVTTEIIPLKLVFSDGQSLNGESRLQDTLNSPIFKKATYTSGYTQYGDAILRAEFWKYIQKDGPDYHVLLQTPKVYSTITLTVPAADGLTGTASRTGALIGETDIDWFDGQLQTIMAALHISPKTFPIFLTANDFQYENGDPTQCCVIGYHSANFTTTSSGKSVIQTYAWSSFTTPGIFSVPINDINPLSHEVSEWFNDPFIDNLTPNWQSPLAPQYGCNNFLETGDPLVGVAFPVKTEGKTYHPQDEAFFSWFADQSPSIGIKGRYTYLGTFTTYAPTC